MGYDIVETGTSVATFRNNLLNPYWRWRNSWR